MKTLKPLLLLLTVFSLFMSCKKEPKRISSGPSITPGTVKGIVKLYDEFGVPLKNMEGVEVTLLGTSIAFTTLADGKYQLRDVPTGTYSIKYSKKGFGYYIKQVPVTGNGTYSVDPVPLYELSSGVIKEFEYDGYDSASLGYNFTITFKSIPANTKQLYMILPASTSPSINATDPATKIQYEQAVTWNLVNFSTMTAKINVPKSYLIFAAKKEIFIRAFITVAGSLPIMDYDTGLQYFGNFTNVSPEISFKSM